MTDTVKKRVERFTWEEGEIVVLTKKHLAGGKHDHPQKRHGHRGAAAGGSKREVKIDKNWSRVSNDRGSTLVYHGTNKAFAQAIQEQGLRVHGGEMHDNPDDRKPAVYFTTDLDTAMEYGSANAAWHDADQFAIVEIEVPASHRGKVQTDDVDYYQGFTESFRIEQDVPASWIQRVRTFSDDWEEVKAKKPDGTVYSVVFIRNPESKAEKHLGSQHAEQQRHGWRYGGGSAGARSSMRGRSREERQEYKKRARAALGRAPKPEPKPKPDTGPPRYLDKIRYRNPALGVDHAGKVLIVGQGDRAGQIKIEHQIGGSTYRKWVKADRVSLVERHGERPAPKVKPKPKPEVKPKPKPEPAVDKRTAMKKQAAETRQRIAAETKANNERKNRIRAQKKALEAESDAADNKHLEEWKAEHGTADGWWDSPERRARGREYGDKIIALNDEMRSGSRESTQRVKDMVKVSDPADPLDMYSTGGKFTKGQQRKVDQINSEFGDLVSKDVVAGADRDFVGTRFEKGVRAYHERGNIVLAPNDNVGTGVHEMGHWLEYRNQEVGGASRRFLRRRTENERTVQMNDVARRGRYDSSERTKVDKFIEPYMGKIYRSGSTEILSMGLEMFFKNPERLARMDPDYFDFVFGIVRGVDLS